MAAGLPVLPLLMARMLPPEMAMSTGALPYPVPMAAPPPEMVAMTLPPEMLIIPPSVLTVF